MIFERIKEYRLAKGLNMSQLAEIINISQGALSLIESGKSKPGSEILEALIAKTDIHPFWLMTGLGSMLKEEGIDYASFFKSEDYKMKEVHDIAGAGEGKDLREFESIDQIPIPKEYNQPYIVAVKIRGESMIPTLYEGAVVLVNTEDRKLVSGRIYIVWINDGAVCKRLFTEPNKIIVKSDNPLFPTFSLSLDEIPDYFVYGRVIYISQKI